MTEHEPPNDQGQFHAIDHLLITDEDSGEIVLKKSGIEEKDLRTRNE